MRRVGRWILNAVTGLSLILCIAVVVLWVWSYWRAPGAKWKHYDHTDALTKQRVNSVIVARGDVLLGHIVSENSNDRLIRYGIDPATLKTSFKFQTGEAKSSLRTMVTTSNSRQYTFAGFSFAHLLPPPEGRSGPSESKLAGWDVLLPLWSIVLLFIWLPSIRFIRLVRWQRAQQRVGRCPRCNYELTANLSGVCPECGTAIEIRESRITNPQ